MQRQNILSMQIGAGLPQPQRINPVAHNLYVPTAAGRESFMTHQVHHYTERRVPTMQNRSASKSSLQPINDSSRQKASQRKPKVTSKIVGVWHHSSSERPAVRAQAHGYLNSDSPPNRHRNCGCCGRGADHSHSDEKKKPNVQLKFLQGGKMSQMAKKNQQLLYLGSSLPVIQSSAEHQSRRSLEANRMKRSNRPNLNSQLQTPNPMKIVQDGGVGYGPGWDDDVRVAQPKREPVPNVFHQGNIDTARRNLRTLEPIDRKKISKGRKQQMHLEYHHGYSQNQELDPSILYSGMLNNDSRFEHFPKNTLNFPSTQKGNKIGKIQRKTHIKKGSKGSPKEAQLPAQMITPYKNQRNDGLLNNPSLPQLQSNSSKDQNPIYQFHSNDRPRRDQQQEQVLFYSKNAPKQFYNQDIISEHRHGLVPPLRQYPNQNQNGGMYTDGMNTGGINSSGLNSGGQGLISGYPHRGQGRRNDLPQYNTIDPFGISNNFSNQDSSKGTFPTDPWKQPITPNPVEQEYFSATMAIMKGNNRRINNLSPVLQSQVEKSKTQMEGASIRISDALPAFIREVTAANPIPNERYNMAMAKDKSAQASLHKSEQQQKPILVDAGQTTSHELIGFVPIPQKHLQDANMGTSEFEKSLRDANFGTQDMRVSVRDANFGTSVREFHQMSTSPIPFDRFEVVQPEKSAVEAVKNTNQSNDRGREAGEQSQPIRSGQQSKGSSNIRNLAEKSVTEYSIKKLNENSELVSKKSQRSQEKQSKSQPKQAEPASTRNKSHEEIKLVDQELDAQFQSKKQSQHTIYVEHKTPTRELGTQTIETTEKATQTPPKPNQASSDQISLKQQNKQMSRNGFNLTEKNASKTNQDLSSRQNPNLSQRESKRNSMSSKHQAILRQRTSSVFNETENSNLNKSSQKVTFIGEHHATGPEPKKSSTSTQRDNAGVKSSKHSSRRLSQEELGGQNGEYQKWVDPNKKDSVASGKPVTSSVASGKPITQSATSKNKNKQEQSIKSGKEKMAKNAVIENNKRFVNTAQSPGNQTQTSWHQKKLNESKQKMTKQAATTMAKIDVKNTAQSPGSLNAKSKKSIKEKGVQNKPNQADAALSAWTMSDKPKISLDTKGKFKDTAQSPGMKSVRNGTAGVQAAPNMVDQSQSAWHQSFKNSEKNAMVNAATSPLAESSHDGPTNITIDLQQRRASKRSMSKKSSLKSRKSRIEESNSPAKSRQQSGKTPAKSKNESSNSPARDGPDSGANLNHKDLTIEVEADDCRVTPSVSKGTGQNDFKTLHLDVASVDITKDNEGRDIDWKNASVFKLVYELMNLPPENRIQAAKALDQEFLDPVALDIFTENEASYNAMLLKKRDEHKQEPYSEEILEGLFQKSKRSVEILSEYLLLSKTKQLEDIIDILEQTREHPGGAYSARQPGESVVLLHTAYREVSIETSIKLMLRIRKLYQALYEVKKILQLVIKQEDLFSEGGLIFSCLEKYKQSPEQQMTVQDESIIMRGFQVLRQVSRRISHFLNDNRIYKHFIFNKADHQLTLLNHARNLASFLRESQPESSKKYQSDATDIEEYILQAMAGNAISDRLSALSTAHDAAGGSSNAKLADLSSLAIRIDGAVKPSKQGVHDSNASTIAHSITGVDKSKR